MMASLAAATQSLVPNHDPHQFLPEINSSYCPKGSHPVNVPAIIGYYPYTSKDVYGIIGDYFNISWINPTFVVTHSGKDNTPYSAIRNQTGDPFSASELLTSWTTVDTHDGFYFQETVKPLVQVTVQPGWTVVDSRPMLELRPACQNQGAQLSWHLTFCFATNSSATPPGFNESAADAQFIKLASAGTTQALKNVWNILEAPSGRNTIFNSTTSCDAIHKYQHKQHARFPITN